MQEKSTKIYIFYFRWFRLVYWVFFLILNGVDAYTKKN